MDTAITTVAVFLFAFIIVLVLFCIDRALGTDEADVH